MIDCVRVGLKDFLNPTDSDTIMVRSQVSLKREQNIFFIRCGKSRSKKHVLKL